MKTLLLAAAAAAFVALSPAGASAAPINATPIAAAQDAGVTQVHWRGGHRHGGWNRGYHRNYGWQRHHHRHYGWAQPRFRAYYY